MASCASSTADAFEVLAASSAGVTCIVVRTVLRGDAISVMLVHELDESAQAILQTCPASSHDAGMGQRSAIRR